MARSSVAGAGFGVLFCLAATATAAEIVEGTFMSEGGKRKYAVFAPSVGEADRPLVIVLHGSGGTGLYMVERWQELAEREGFVVAGLDSATRRNWAPPKDGPAQLRDLVETLRDRAIDRRRVYLFGYSAGGIFTLYMAPLECRYFAAAVVNAAALGGEADVGYLAAVERKIPMLLIHGSKDRLFPLGQVRETVATFARHGLELRTSMIPGGEHVYTRPDDINVGPGISSRRTPSTPIPCTHPWSLGESSVKPWTRRSPTCAPTPSPTRHFQHPREATPCRIVT